MNAGGRTGFVEIDSNVVGVRINEQITRYDLRNSITKQLQRDRHIKLGLFIMQTFALS